MVTANLAHNIAGATAVSFYNAMKGTSVGKVKRTPRPHVYNENIGIDRHWSWPSNNRYEYITVFT